MREFNQEVIHTYVVLAYKESEYLEECIKSVLNQDYPSHVLIGTSTDNDYIRNLASKYNLEVVVNEIKGGGNAVDFDFAWNAGRSELVTIAHQDDTYDKNYSLEIVKAYNKEKNAQIIFTDYFEIRNGEKVYSNTLLNIKRILLSPLRLRFWAGSPIIKKSVICLGDSICCPAVTFCKKNIKSKSVFVNDQLNGNSDWYGWLQLAKIKGGKFIFIPKSLMGHRVHQDTHTSREINANTRSPQDLIMFEKFWPKPIAKFINYFYQKSEKSNNL
ncbi:MAG: glycosyltransferase family 2 protein [Erysipelotrichaceae bacterium]|nr:glycosyltransferase family 2 protein [Erysipelotrichaceae bacterium]